jgi:hypothetical protein
MSSAKEEVTKCLQVAKSAIANDELDKVLFI